MNLNYVTIGQINQPLLNGNFNIGGSFGNQANGFSGINKDVYKQTSA